MQIMVSRGSGGDLRMVMMVGDSAVGAAVCARAGGEGSAGYVDGNACGLRCIKM